MRYWPGVICLLLSLHAICQEQASVVPDSTANATFQTIVSVPSRALKSVDKKYSTLSHTIQKQSEQLLKCIQQREDKLYQKLAARDSSKAAALFSTSKTRYAAFKNQLQSPVQSATIKLKTYIPGLDSTNTILRFLSQNSQGLSAEKLEQLSSVTNTVTELQGRLQQADELQAFIYEKQAQLKEALANTGVGKELTAFNKTVYYYQQQFEAYKTLLNDKKKLEARLINTVKTLPAFKKFWDKYSYLAQLFPIPADYEGNGQSIAGLQTVAGVQQQLQERFGAQMTMPSANNTGGSSAFQGQLGAARDQLNGLKDKINNAGGGNSDMTMPDFKPNDQKTKSFLKRLEYGIDFQSEQGTNFLPATTDIAVHLGYKISDGKVLGVAASYKLGWGSGWDHIRLSSEGLGLRSYVDIKVKGSLWLTGGFEYNYRSSFSSLRDLHVNIDVWQRSALAGLTKKYKISKNREGKIQVLYDFLHNRQVPVAQGLKFRVGYNF